MINITRNIFFAKTQSSQDKALRLCEKLFFFKTYIQRSLIEFQDEHELIFK